MTQEEIDIRVGYAFVLGLVAGWVSLTGAVYLGSLVLQVLP